MKEKLSFSLPSKPRSNLRETTSTNPTAGEAFINGEDSKDSREFVTEFDPSKVSSKQGKGLVIAPIQNEWRPEKRLKNFHLPHQSDDENQGLQFVLASVSTSSLGQAGDSTGYGLNVRGTENSNKEPGTGAKSSEDLLLHKLRGDLENLSDAKGFDEYEDVPVEGFGLALLSGYGWKEGRGIGRGWDKKEDVKVVEIQRRTAKEGLGFTGEIPNLTPNDLKGKQVTAKEDTGGRSSRPNEVNKEKNGQLRLGKVVRIIGGKYMGVKGKVVAVKRDGYVLLRDSKSEDEVKVQVRDVADIGSVEEESCLKKMKELRLREQSDASKRKRDIKTSGERMKDRKAKESKVLWLRSNIRVRIISKEIKGGRLYLKKGVVLDVVGPTTCDISMDDSRELIQGVDQDFLETAIPKRGGGVIVLYGKNKDAYGSLVERDTEKETGVIRDGDTHELINVRLEQIAEFVGDPSDIGY